MLACGAAWGESKSRSFGFKTRLGGAVQLDGCSRVGSLGQKSGAPSGSPMQILVPLGREGNPREREALRCRALENNCGLSRQSRVAGGSGPTQVPRSPGLTFPVCRVPKLSSLPCPGSVNQGSCDLVSSVIILV